MKHRHNCFVATRDSRVAIRPFGLLGSAYLVPREWYKGYPRLAVGQPHFNLYFLILWLPALQLFVADFEFHEQWPFGLKIIALMAIYYLIEFPFRLNTWIRLRKTPAIPHEDLVLFTMKEKLFLGRGSVAPVLGAILVSFLQCYLLFKYDYPSTFAFLFDQIGILLIVLLIFLGSVVFELLPYPKGFQEKHDHYNQILEQLKIRVWVPFSEQEKRLVKKIFANDDTVVVAEPKLNEDGERRIF